MFKWLEDYFGKRYREAYTRLENNYLKTAKELTQTQKKLTNLEEEYKTLAISTDVKMVLVNDIDANIVAKLVKQVQEDKAKANRKEKHIEPTIDISGEL